MVVCCMDRHLPFYLWNRWLQEGEEEREVEVEEEVEEDDRYPAKV